MYVLKARDLAWHIMSEILRITFFWLISHICRLPKLRGKVVNQIHFYESEDEKKTNVC